MDRALLPFLLVLLAKQETANSLLHALMVSLTITVRIWFKHIILAGIHDEEIKRKVLSADSIDDKTLNETIALIEMEEMASSRGA